MIFVYCMGGDTETLKSTPLTSWSLIDSSKADTPRLVVVIKYIINRVRVREGGRPLPHSSDLFELGLQKDAHPPEVPMVPTLSCGSTTLIARLYVSEQSGSLCQATALARS